ncbi:Pimeloyl-ACP methyl ester carboxylesterase [Devosia enhydra]|uniref:Pimeloyl-ACP methyl ester carboxylesterase n=1 Tax=Devosia enhydra TaxID=665118 RepID=A0A1K2HZY6_9HYPH|nr:alpha/beta hydrolase [Devosia enhydra]SFZ84842.1 Pimeloyl-ACP methyl ester carboxylesterase [Devosia enhydra]
MTLTRHLVPRGADVTLEVLKEGEGPLVVMLPSLGRPATDFDPIAAEVAAAGYTVLRPQPRGIGASVSAEPWRDLHDCAADIATIIEAFGDGPAFVAGHAFGNRVTRMLATDRPDLISGISIIAANVGIAPSGPKMRAAIRASANPDLPAEERLEALRFAFFAPGNDPTGWLEDWYPEVLAAQRHAGDQTPRHEDYAGGSAPLLYLQPDTDPLAHVEDAEIFKRELGDRVTVVVIPNASHAALPEQPGFIARELLAFMARVHPAGRAA